jgi:hypothetical protein
MALVLLRASPPTKAYKPKKTMGFIGRWLSIKTELKRA